MVGILTNLERRFGISSKKSGALLSFYDIGHTAAVILIGFIGSGKNLPRITATADNIAGVILSAVSMFILALPVILFGPESFDEMTLARQHQKYILENICDRSRFPQDLEQNCKLERDEHLFAFCVLSIGQILAGIAAAPFNTIAYVYIDDNVQDKSKSPFYLGLLSSMYAFAPAFGFALSSAVTRIYATIVDGWNFCGFKSC
ncbi:unnamed protein product [Gongylonema pulchrum]|uniref:MFS domain-containing protein n=1 Tax=Gongylonema pulchrum TaxID=637853 RepID=A0A183DEJ6_9BILA|nr:unnamed protein product [Gongylonema pulchrum]